ncbi:uncharacterized protein LOC143859436 [Tasmannia lanceolata]|uniref:uncharacterized protein LOC143859436 n=1 Tax=Tasmannia lanceolata TaxID=3420 RepID=UPI0040642F99
MGVVIDPTCPLCKSEEESIDHLFFKCSYSAWLWKSILWRNGHRRTKNQSLLAEEDWLRHHSKGTGQATVAFKLCFCSLIHNIWMERTRRIFESSEKHKRFVLNKILTEISIKMNGLKIKDKNSPRNISTATNLKYRHIPDDPSSRYCSWSPPKEDELKLNSDTSLDSNGGGLGGLIRDNRGMIKNLFSINVDKREIYELELQAIERGIDLALSMNCLNIWIESDSKLAVDIILGNVHVPWKQKQTLRQIRSYLEHLSWRISHSWREGNCPADQLSKRNYPHKGFPSIVFLATQSLLSAVIEDMNGSLYLRL